MEQQKSKEEKIEAKSLKLTSNISTPQSQAWSQKKTDDLNHLYTFAHKHDLMSGNNSLHH